MAASPWPWWPWWLFMARDARDRELDRDLAADLNLDLVALARGGPGPYRVQAQLPVVWIAARLAHTDAEIQHPARVDLEVTVIGEGASVLVRGVLHLEFTVPCARCLDPALVPAGTDLCVHFVRGAAHSARGDADDDGDEVDATAPDERSFAGNHVDLRPMLEEQILVAYPIRALCGRGEECLGLCMHCGASLNEQAPGDRCAVCGQLGARVPVVNAPGHAEGDDHEDAGQHADPGNASVAAPVVEGLAAEDSPWKQALRGLKGLGLDPAAASDPHAPHARSRKKPPN